MAKLISGTYGEALFELAVEEDRLDSLAEEIRSLQQILSENKDLDKLMNHPKISKDEKLQVMENIFKEKLDKTKSNSYPLVQRSANFFCKRAKQ